MQIKIYYIASSDGFLLMQAEKTAVMIVCLNANMIGRKHTINKDIQDIMNLIREKDIKMGDINGMYRHVTIPAQDFSEEAMRNGIGFDVSNYYCVAEYHNPPSLIQNKEKA